MAVLAVREVGERRLMLFGDGRPEHFNVASRGPSGAQHWRYPMRVESGGILGPAALVSELRALPHGQAAIELACQHFRCADPGEPTAPARAAAQATQSRGTVVLVHSEFTLTWKDHKPRRWANFVAFLHDASKRKRAFHFAFNGIRFNQTADVERMSEDEPDMYVAVSLHLMENAGRYCRPTNNHEDEDEHHD